MIKGIVCIGANGVMGKDGGMPWGDIPLDGKHFKNLTEGHIVVMGRKTFESMKKPLPNRVNIVLSRKYVENSGRVDWSYGDLYVVDSRSKALAAYENIKATLCDPSKDLWVIGGAEIFEEFLPFIDEFYVTTVGAAFEGDTHFPDIHRHDYWKSELLGMDTAVVVHPPKIFPAAFEMGTRMPDKEMRMETTTYHLIFRKFTKVNPYRDR